MNECYVTPAEALRKLQLAKGLRTAVYLYGATGFGKTTLVKQFLSDTDALWVSCKAGPWGVSEQLRRAVPGQCIVLDDLHLLSDEPTQEQVLQTILAGENWVVLIGRMSPPSWLMPLMPGMKIVVISENDLRLTAAEIQKMAQQQNISLSPADVTFLKENSEGNAMVLCLTMERMRDGENLTETLSDQIAQAFGSYLERFVISQWSNTIQDFLMEVSVVDRFTIPLAEAITGDDMAASILRQAANTGNFIIKEGDFYRIRRVLLETLRSRALIQMGRHEYNHCLYNAARFYELHDDVLTALNLYEQCGEKGRIKALLIRNARRHPGDGYYFELRKYYMSLPPEDIRSSAVLMCAVSMLYSILMDTESSEYWYGQLKEFSGHATGGDRKEAISRLVYLDICLPHRGIIDMINILKAAPALLAGNETALPEINLTSNLPSTMSGGKDFCEWSKTDKLLADTIGGILERLLGKRGSGLVNAALGESYYEKGVDSYTVLSHLTRCQSEAETTGTIQMVFVSVGLQTRLSLTAGNTAHAESLLDGMEQLVIREKADKLLPNIRALRCIIDLMKNDTEAVARWMETAPDETQEFFSMERLRYLVKARCYLAQGNDLAALTLMERLNTFADASKRTYLGMQCGLLRCIAMRRLGMDWKNLMLHVLETASEYKFIRVISEEGAAVAPLLHDVKYAFYEAHPDRKKWLDRLITEAEQMMHRYPSYLRGPGVDLSAFSATALNVLRMQAGGYSAKEIADQLGISQRTVKYHATENYRKLNAKGMLDAVQIARSLNIL